MFNYYKRKIKNLENMIETYQSDLNYYKRKSEIYRNEIDHHKQKIKDLEDYSKPKFTQNEKLKKSPIKTSSKKEQIK